MHILLVDDHPLIIDSYKLSLFSSVPHVGSVRFSTAQTCEEAYNLIQNTSREESFTLAILDYRLPQCTAKGLFSGVDLAEVIKKIMVHCKVIVSTSYSEMILIYDLVQNRHLNGVMIKSDLTPQSLAQGVAQVLNDEIFQSTAVKNIVTKIWENDIMTDAINRKILLHIYNGYRVKDLEPLVSLSTSSIKRRIAQMKDSLGILEGGSLIKEAKLQGYI
jgi:two-component system response regulator NreC